MKLDKAKLDRVLKSPDSIGALLFYGPDEGLAHEYAGLAQKAVLGGAGDDPFRLAELTPDDLKGDGARLADELNAISMLGGRRVVRIAQASNMIADQIETAMRPWTRAMPSPTWRTLPTSERSVSTSNSLIRSLRIEVISSGRSFIRAPY